MIGRLQGAHRPAVSGRCAPGPLVCVSPHLDDAVFGCADALCAAHEALVVTVFAGEEPPGQSITDWDRSAGYEPGERVVAQRRREDAEALASIGVGHEWLEHLDAQYLGAERLLRPIVDDLVASLERSRPAAVLAPLGLSHPDHVAAREATLLALSELAARGARPTVTLYAEAIHRLAPRALPDALDALARRGFILVEVGSPPARPEKRRACARYPSQLKALAASGDLGPLGDVIAPERYWRIASGTGRARSRSGANASGVPAGLALAAVTP